MASRISNTLPFLIITLICVLGVEGGYLALERFVIDPVIKAEPRAEEQSAQQVQQPRQRPKAAAPVDYGVITRRNLFGPPPQAGSSPVVETPPEAIEATSLEVVLMGTIGGGDDSRAIILNKQDRKQEIYSVGDSVQGALIKEILRGKVILNLDGRDEMLDMSEAAQYGATAPRRPVSVNPAIRTRRIVEAPDVNGTDQPGEVAPRTRVVRPTRRIIRPQPTDQLNGGPEAEAEVAAELEEPGDEVVEEPADETVEQPGDELGEELVEEQALDEAVEQDGEAAEQL